MEKLSGEFLSRTTGKLRLLDFFEGPGEENDLPKVPGDILPGWPFKNRRGDRLPERLNITTISDKYN